MKLIEVHTADWGRRNWDLAAPDIRCRADGVGAVVWEFETSRGGGSVQRLTWPLVLAHDEASAKAALWAWAEERQHEEAPEGAGDGAASNQEESK